jgi:predicted Zn-dependent peptidase
MIHVITKTHSRMATIMVAFDAGARVESGGKYNAGIAHMLEHSLFKGTSKRDSIQIQKEIAFLGGFSNAFTSHESVAYYVSVPYENLEPCIEILSDMVFNPIFPEDELLKEREVVKEEEASSLDDPQSYMWRQFSSGFFTNYLADPVIGTSDSISLFSKEEVGKFHSEYCQRKDAVVSLCSNLKKKDAKCLLNKYFGSSTGKIKKLNNFGVSEYHESRFMELERPGIEHTYVWRGTPSITTGSELEASAQVLMTILGRGMDSRLFTEVREKRGLVYGISASFNDWQYGGLTLVEFSTREKNVADAVGIVDEEINAIKTVSCTQEELQRAKNKMRSSFYAAIEDSYSMCYWGIKQKLLNIPSIEEYMRRIEAVTSDDVLSAAELMFDQDRCLTLVCRGTGTDGEEDVCQPV